MGSSPQVWGEQYHDINCVLIDRSFILMGHRSRSSQLNAPSCGRCSVLCTDAGGKSAWSQRKQTRSRVKTERGHSEQEEVSETPRPNQELELLSRGRGSTYLSTYLSIYINDQIGATFLWWMHNSTCKKKQAVTCSTENVLRHDLSVLWFVHTLLPESVTPPTAALQTWLLSGSVFPAE